MYHVPLQGITSRRKGRRLLLPMPSRPLSAPRALLVPLRLPLAFVPLFLLPLLTALAFLVPSQSAFASEPSQDARAATCPNDTIRAAQAATFLPDCRAFELVNPPGDTPQIQGQEQIHLGARASSVGGEIAWFSYYPLSGSLGGEFYNISTRNPGGWSTEPVGPRLSATNSGLLECRPTIFFSADLSKAILRDGFGSTGVEQTAIGECPGNSPALVANEPEGFQNLYTRDSATGGYALVNVTPAGVTPGNAWFQDASNDFTHVVFEDPAKLTATAPVGASLYEWVAGHVSLVSVLPSGEPTVGTSPGAIVGGGVLNGTDPITHPVSAGGTRAIFEAGGSLYLRENVEQELESTRGLGGECLESAKACTVQLDASRAEGTGGGGSFLAANATDTRIFFTDDAKARLTVDTVSGSGQHLYEYDTQTGDLNDLTPGGELGLRGLSGLSDDGSYLYLVAQARLAAGAVAGAPNLYVFHGGAPEFIVTLADEREDARDWTSNELTAKVSPNGRSIGFNSVERLTGYDNTPAQPGDCTHSGAPAPCPEIFLYDTVQHELHCVSCVPGGGRPTGPTELPRIESSSDSWGPVYVERNVLDDGRVFFDSPDPLLSGAGNGVSNVYEYEEGRLSMISTGTSDANSFFYDASTSGDDVFFATTQRLVQSDTGSGMRLYDARVGGGFPEPEGPTQCIGEGCRAAGMSIPEVPAVVTSGRQASGNLLPAKRKMVMLTRRQKLERELRACRRTKNKRKRAACARHAHARYGTRSSRVNQRTSK